MFECFRKRKKIFTVVVHVNGRHPYLKSNELDRPSRDVEFVVPARDWNDAAEQAILGTAGLNGYRYNVKSIRQGTHATS